MGIAGSRRDGNRTYPPGDDCDAGCAAPAWKLARETASLVISRKGD